PHSSSPSSQISPAVMEWKPAIALSRVVLPQPDGPTIMQTSPGAISIEQSLTARMFTPLGSYAFDTLRIDSAPLVANGFCVDAAGPAFRILDFAPVAAIHMPPPLIARTRHCISL